MKDKKTLIIIALGVVIIALLYWGQNAKSNQEQQAALYTAANDSLQTTVNKLGQEEAKIALLMGTHEDDCKGV